MQPIFFSSPPTKSLCYTTYMGVHLADHVGWLYVQNQLVTLDLWVSSLKCIPCWLGLLTDLLSYNTLTGAPP